MTQLIILISLSIATFLIGIAVGRTRHSLHPNTKSKMDKLRYDSNTALKERTKKRKSRIMAIARKNGRITNDDVEELFYISDRTANRYLNELESDGELSQVGETGSGVYYTPK